MTGLEKYQYFLRLMHSESERRRTLGFNEWFKEVHRTVGGTPNTVANIKRVLALGSEIADKVLEIITDFNSELDHNSKKKFDSVTGFNDFLMITWYVFSFRFIHRIKRFTKDEIKENLKILETKLGDLVSGNDVKPDVKSKFHSSNNNHL